MTAPKGQLCLCAMVLVAALADRAAGQGLTGRISGLVQDPTGNPVAGVTVVLENANTGQPRSATTGETGDFAFTELLRGNYILQITVPGFKKYEQRDIVLSATERVNLGTVTLELGELTQSVSVTAETARVQTQSAERSGLVNASQLAELSLKGRDYLGLLILLPGVVDVNTRDGPSVGSGFGLNFNGVRRRTLSINLDGTSIVDTGSQNEPTIAPGLDTIAEVKVLLTNYQAEYGRSSGGVVNVVTKSGTRELHGSAFWFKRNEALNANEFFNNVDGLRRPRYRYDYYGYTVGGPVVIPGLVRTRNRLFFFWAQEFLPRRDFTAPRRRTFPTALERQGDFSKTVDTNGRLFPVYDPLNNRAPFPGNVIPANRIDPNGRGLLNIFPLPGTADPSNTYNSVMQTPVESPHNESMLRIDWAIGQRTTFYARGNRNYDSSKSAQHFLGFTDWPLLPTAYELPGRNVSTSLIHTFSPTFVNEFTLGYNRGREVVSPWGEDVTERVDRTKLGLKLPQFHPELNPLNVIPNASYGGITNAPSLTMESRFPYFSTQSTWIITNNVSKIVGGHNIKAGIYIEKSARNDRQYTNFNGSFDFGRNVNNPLDANHPFANGLMGLVNSYSEVDARPVDHGRFMNEEWFVQDTWKVTRRFTLDFGMRFYATHPTYTVGAPLATFRGDAWDPAKAPRLIEPYRASPTAPRQGRNPVTGELLPEIKIGTFAPGVGSTSNGMVVIQPDGDRYNLMKSPPIQLAPRFGFAWDVFGTGRTAVRAGGGIFYDRFYDNLVFAHNALPPLVNTSTANYTTIQALLSTPLSLSPSLVYAIEDRFIPPRTYNWSFGIQQNLGFGTVLDVAYVGTAGRNLQQRKDLNAAPYGSNFLPQNIDSTLTGNRPLPSNFVRPVRGYTGIVYNGWFNSSNYHSMQTQVNRRFRRDFVFGLSWTWSKTMGFQDDPGEYVNPFLPLRARHYGKAAWDRTHSFVVNYDYKLPRASAAWKTPVARVLDDWEISGITSFISGAPLGIGYSFVQATDITGAVGSGVDSRVILTGNPVLPKGERSFSRAFRTDVVRPPLASDLGIGNAPKDPIRGPGINNWDISIFRNIPLAKEEARRLQFRFEMYNAFNHTQFSGVNTAARFDANGNQVNARFGEYSAARVARRIQLALKFYF